LNADPLSITGVRLITAALAPTAMAKDSDKRRLLNRRKQEIDHALNHGFDAAAIACRADKLRTAAIAVIKKFRSDFAHVSGAPRKKEWIELTERWERFTTDEIVELAKKWEAIPSLQDVQLVHYAEQLRASR
jgi:hypothetical protein